MSFPSTPSSASSVMTIDIVRINRISNAQALLAANAFRVSYRPTHHAKKLAQKLNLTVNTIRARNLDQKHVSTVPLPIIEISPLPAIQQEPTRLALPLPRELSRAVVGREREMKRLARPILRCDIPQDVVNDSSSLSSGSSYQSSNQDSALSAQAPCVLRGKNVPWVGPTSCWSASTTGQNSEMFSFDSDEELNLPESSYEVIDEPIDQSPVAKQVDLNSCSWEASPINDNSPSSSSSGSSGPVTPEDQESIQPKVVIRVKRSTPSDEDLTKDILEKRPKYERKSWVSPRRTVRMSIHDTKPF